MECSYCNNLLPEKGFFCPNCVKQFKCKSCEDYLLKDAKACINCGTPVANSTSISNMNTIEFTESKNGRSFKANFTDAVGQSIGETFGVIISNKLGTKVSNVLPNKTASVTTKSVHLEEAEIVDETIEGADLQKLKKIFKSDGEKTTLSETRLKANSKREYGIRLILIFLYYKLLQGIDKVPRKELTSILQNASVEDGNLRFWISKNSWIGVGDDLVELKAPGIDNAKKYLLDIGNAELKDGWSVGSQPKAHRKSKEKVDDKDNSDVKQPKASLESDLSNDQKVAE